MGGAGIPSFDSRETTSENGTIRAELLGTALQNHIASFHYSDRSQLTVAGAFVKHELERDRRVLYVHERDDPTPITDALQEAGVEPQDTEETLQHIHRRNLQDESASDTNRTLEAIIDRHRRATSAGDAGISAVFDHMVREDPCQPVNQLLDFEYAFESHLQQSEANLLCQYPLNKMPDRVILRALQTHRQIIYRDRVCESPFYTPTTTYHADTGPMLDTRVVLEHAHALEQSKNDLERREQRLEVLNRLLRHNVRNDLNIVLGQLQDTLDSGQLSEENERRIRQALLYTNRIYGSAEKARVVEDIFTNDEFSAIPVGEVVTEVVERTRNEHPELDITLQAEENPTAIANTHLTDAIEELVTNAIRHQSRMPPSVRLTLSTTKDTVSLEARNPGGPIPKEDRMAIQEGTETPLAHGSGLGLWMVKWVVEASKGTLRFPEADNEAVAQIELPKL